MFMCSFSCVHVFTSGLRWTFVTCLLTDWCTDDQTFYVFYRRLFVDDQDTTDQTHFCLWVSEAVSECFDLFPMPINLWSYYGMLSYTLCVSMCVCMSCMCVCVCTSCMCVCYCTAFISSCSLNTSSSSSENKTDLWSEYFDLSITNMKLRVQTGADASWRRCDVMAPSGGVLTSLYLHLSIMLLQTVWTDFVKAVGMVTWQTTFNMYDGTNRIFVDFRVSAPKCVLSQLWRSPIFYC